jgi:hypothetical protein
MPEMCQQNSCYDSGDGPELITKYHSIDSPMAKPFYESSSRSNIQRGNKLCCDKRRIEKDIQSEMLAYYSR